MLNLTIKIRLHLQKSSHLFFSPKIAIFVLSCKEIRRRRRRNGQAGARPCKMTVGDAGTETENRCNSLIYIGLTFVRKHLYPALFSLLLETFFVSEFAQKKKILICISTPYNRIYDLPPEQSCSDKSTFRTYRFGFFHRNVCNMTTHNGRSGLKIWHEAGNRLSLLRIVNIMIMQDMINGRCGWCGTDELYVKYHDQEWGKLVTDDKTLFEFLVLESAQAGLSWITILRKREGYRKAFCNFDAVQVAQMTDSDVERLMRFDGIVRNRLKIKSTITNARLFLALQEEFGSFYNYTLSFFPDRKPITNTFGSLSEIPASSPESDAMSKDMKKRGFKFFGSTICYAHLQAAGFIDDHLTDCICRKR